MGTMSEGIREDVSDGRDTQKVPETKAGRAITALGVGSAGAQSVVSALYNEGTCPRTLGNIGLTGEPIRNAESCPHPRPAE